MNRAYIVGAAFLLRAGFVSAQMSAGTSDPKPPVPSGKQVSFTFDRKGVPVEHYVFTVGENGTASYQGQETPIPARYASPAQVQPAAHPFDQKTTLSRATVDQIFSGADKLKRFHVDCGSKLKNIADTGNKTLRYDGPDGSGSCTYNYSDNKDVQALTKIFQGVAETMDQGRRLDQLHRFDRLGLDEAIKDLSDEVSSGRALEIGSIAASLRSIAADPELIARVRSRATTLLSQVPAP